MPDFDKLTVHLETWNFGLKTSTNSDVLIGLKRGNGRGTQGSRDLCNQEDMWGLPCQSANNSESKHLLNISVSSLCQTLEIQLWLLYL